MEILGTGGITLETEPGGKAGFGAALATGARLTARVVEVLSEGRARVDFGRFQAVAAVSFPIAAGDEFVVEVVQPSGPLRLTVVTAPETASAEAFPRYASAPESARRFQEALAALRPLPAPGAEIGRLLERLAFYFEPLRPEAGAEALAARLRTLAERSGLFFENDLEAALGPAPGRPAAAAANAPFPAGEGPALHRVLQEDLKPQLALLRRLLAPEGEAAGRIPGAADIARGAAELLEAIGRQQAAAALRRDEADPFQMVQLHLPPLPGARRAALKIGCPKRRGRRAAEGFRAALLLDLERIGAVRVDLLLVERELRIAFFVAARPVQEAVEQGAAELRSILAPHFDSVHLTAAVSPRRIARFDAEELLPAERRRLDVRV